MVRFKLPSRCAVANSSDSEADTAAIQLESTYSAADGAPAVPTFKYNTISQVLLSVLYREVKNYLHGLLQTSARDIIALGKVQMFL